MSDKKANLPAVQPRPKLPTIAELKAEPDMDYAENALMVILNSEPDPKWLLPYPEFMKMPLDARYMPVARTKYLLHRIFGKWWVEVLDRQVMANAVTCTVRLFVVNPITGLTEHQDGVGSVDIQTEKGATAMDAQKTKAMAVMKALPAAKSFAIKDASEEFGRIFGRDLSSKQQMNYTELLKPKSTTTEELRQLLEEKQEKILPNMLTRYENIIEKQETGSYNKMKKELEAIQ